MATVLGITGGIGSGKSTATKILSEILNAPILDADIIAKQSFSDEEIVSKIKSFFGNGIFDQKNSLNKEELSKIVFGNPQKLLELNKIIHPYVMKKIAECIKDLSDSNEYILLDVPLPNKEFINLSDKIIVIIANEQTRIDRAMKRLKISEKDIKKRIAGQMPIENYIKLADYVVKNNGTIEELKNNLIELCHDI